MSKYHVAIEMGGRGRSYIAYFERKAQYDDYHFTINRNHAKDLTEDEAQAVIDDLASNGRTDAKMLPIKENSSEAEEAQSPN